MSKTIQRRRSELLVRFIPILRSYVRRRSADREAARDALQEIILHVLSDPNCPEDAARFTEYCRSVAQQVVGREPPPLYAAPSAALPEMEDELSDDDNSEPPDPLGDPEHAADTREELSRAIHRLNDDALRLLVRRYVLEENANELARDLSQTPAAMRVRLMRLRSAARSAMR